MPRTTTRFVNFGMLNRRGQSSIAIVKLMMACNDLSLADEALSEWKKEQPNNRIPRQTGAKMYFVRIQLAHLYEALKIIEDIRNDQKLIALVAQCDLKTKESFQHLEEFLPKGSKRREFEKLVGRLRNNLTFHYDKTGELIKKAMIDRAARPEAQMSSITRGNTAHLWRFQAADDVVDSIVVRNIWGVSRDLDVRTETDKVLGRVNQIVLWFVDFSGEFIWKYCENKG